MNNVVLIWTDCNPSTIEKNHLILNGLKKNDVNAFALGFVHSKKFKEYFDSVYAEQALYGYQYGIESKLFKGSNIITKALNNIKIVSRFSWTLFKYLKTNKCSIVIIPPQPIELTFPALILSKLFGVKVVPNIMEYYPSLPNFHNKKNILQRWSWFIVCRYSDSYIVISKYLKDKFMAYSKDIFILPAILPESGIEEVDPDSGSKSNISNHNSNNPLFLFTSSSAYDDLLEFALSSLAHISDKEFQFVITGRYTDTQLHKWSERIKSLNLKNKVSFTGFLSDNELHELQLKSTALLIPLINNDRHLARFPQKVLGYMSLAKPVVTTKVGEMAEYFKDGDNIIMCDIDTPGEFCKKLIMFFGVPDITYEIGNRARLSVLDEFSCKTWGARLKVYLEKIEAISG